MRASSLLAVPPPPPEVHPLEGIAGVHLPEANLTQWASYVQDVAAGMRKPPRAAASCPSEDIAGILHRLECLTRIGFCHLCYALGNGCGCSKTTSQANLSYGDSALWSPPSASYVAMAAVTVTTASTSGGGVPTTIEPPPGFPTLAKTTFTRVASAQQNRSLLTQAGVGRGRGLLATTNTTRPQVLGATDVHQQRPSAIKPQAIPKRQETTRVTPYWQQVFPPHQSTGV